MANSKIFLGSVKSPNKLLKLINRAKSILKIQNLFEVNKFFKKALAMSLSALFVIHSVSFVSLNCVGAMNFTMKVTTWQQETENQLKRQEMLEQNAEIQILEIQILGDELKNSVSEEELTVNTEELQDKICQFYSTVKQMYSKEKNILLAETNELTEKLLDCKDKELFVSQELEKFILVAFYEIKSIKKTFEAEKIKQIEAIKIEAERRKALEEKIKKSMIDLGKNGNAEKTFPLSSTKVLIFLYYINLGYSNKEIIKLLKFKDESGELYDISLLMNLRSAIKCITLDSKVDNRYEFLDFELIQIAQLLIIKKKYIEEIIHTLKFGIEKVLKIAAMIRIILQKEDFENILNTSWLSLETIIELNYQYERAMGKYFS
ncbi:MAG: hypothetical protein LBJ32_01245 [Oscillospiraceae bacterium]|jgi:hypothetical protein|nr:hypothetical protein [Oscillospiraceae bacterium]